MGLLCAFFERSVKCEIVFRFGTVLLHLFVFGEDFLKKSTKFSNFQRAVFFFTAHCNFIFSALKISKQRAEIKKTLGIGEKDDGTRLKC